MSKVHTLEPPPHHKYEDDECIVNVFDKDGEQPTRANAAFFLLQALLDLMLTPDDDSGD